MGFDYQFTQLLRSGDIASAKALLLRKYPHLKRDGDRIALYIELYQEHYNNDKSGAKLQGDLMQFHQTKTGRDRW